MFRTYLYFFLNGRTALRKLQDPLVIPGQPGCQPNDGPRTWMKITTSKVYSGLDPLISSRLL